MLTPPETVAAVDVRGGGPGTRETDLLDPSNLVHHVHGVCLAGGSAYGLSAADGVVDWLAGQCVGFPVGPEPHEVVPIVPAAVLFDLGRGGRFEHRPTPAMGAKAAAAARAGAVAEGVVGAGTGAVAGGVKGGMGTASVVLPDGITVAALVAVNASGRSFDVENGLLLGTNLAFPGELPRLRRPHRHELVSALAYAEALVAPLNTTIGVVATDAALTKAECRRLAMAAHDGLARAVRPAHGLTDGDTFFGLATGTAEIEAVEGARTWRAAGTRPVRLNEVFLAAADAVTRAILHAVISADSAGVYLSYRDLFPSAVTPAGRR